MMFNTSPKNPTKSDCDFFPEKSTPSKFVAIEIDWLLSFKWHLSPPTTTLAWLPYDSHDLRPPYDWRFPALKSSALWPRNPGNEASASTTGTPNGKGPFPWHSNGRFYPLPSHESIDFCMGSFVGKHVYPGLPPPWKQCFLPQFRWLNNI